MTPPPEDEQPVIPGLTPARRLYLYGVLIAAAALAGTYGLVTGAQGAAWLGVGAALLGLPIAAANVRR